MWGGHEDGLCTDSIHVDAHSRLQVVQVDVAVLGDQIYHAMLAANLRRKNRGRQSSAVTFTLTSPDEERGGGVFAHLHSDRKVRLGLWREKHVNCFLSKRLVSCSRLTNFNDVQL